MTTAARRARTSLGLDLSGGRSPRGLECTCRPQKSWMNKRTTVFQPMAHHAAVRGNEGSAKSAGSCLNERSQIHGAKTTDDTVHMNLAQPRGLSRHRKQGFSGQGREQDGEQTKARGYFLAADHCGDRMFYSSHEGTKCHEMEEHVVSWKNEIAQTSVSKKFHVAKVERPNCRFFQPEKA